MIYWGASMNKLFNAFLFILLSFSFSYQAQADDMQEIAKIMARTDNQFIYSYFGKQLFLDYLTDENEIDIISKADEAQLKALSAPYNHQMTLIVLVFLSLIYVTTVVYFFYRLVFFIANHLLSRQMPQDNKNMLSKLRESAPYLFRFLIIGALVLFPYSTGEGTFSSYYVKWIFEALGYTDDMTEKRLGDVRDANRNSIETLKLPPYTSKSSSVENLIKFQLCVRNTSSREDPSEHIGYIKFKKAPYGYEGVAREGSCVATFSIAIDYMTGEMIDEISRLGVDIGLTKDAFLNDQKNLYQILFAQLFSKTSDTAVKINTPTYTNEWGFENFRLANYTSIALDDIALSHWYQRCEQLEKLELSGFWSPAEVYFYFKLMANCHSTIIADRLVYPAVFSDTAKEIISPNNLVEISACLNKTNSEIDHFGGHDVDIDTIKLCVLSNCSSNNILTQGNLYACSNLINYYKKSVKDTLVDSKGVLGFSLNALSGYMYTPPTESAKSVYNGFKIEYKPYMANEPIDEPDFVVPIYIPNATPDTQHLSEVIAILEKIIDDANAPKITPSFSYQGFLPKLLGVDRLNVCAKHPMEYYEGYLCNSLIQEYSRFGITLIKNVALLKVSIATAQSAGAINKQVKRIKNPVDTGTVSDAKSEVGGGDTTAKIMGAVKFTLKNILANGNGDEIYDFLTNNFALVGNSTDEFGYLNTEAIYGLLSTPAISGLAYYVFNNPDSYIVSFIDNLLLTLLVIGVVFGILVPLTPVFLIMSVLMKYISHLFSTLISGYQLVDSVFSEENKVFTREIEAFAIDVMALSMRIVLLLIGVVLSYLLSNVVLAKLASKITIPYITNDGVYGVIDHIVVLVVSLIVVYIVYSVVVTIIESFYDFVVEWAMNKEYDTPYSSTKAFNVKDVNEILSLIGRGR
jgi:hypothetical protein